MSKMNKIYIYDILNNMKKADNFNASKWLIENKITTQSRLNEDEMQNMSSAYPQYSACR